MHVLHKPLNSILQEDQAGRRNERMFVELDDSCGVR